jgi:hypothetical protein
MTQFSPAWASGYTAAKVGTQPPPQDRPNAVQPQVGEAPGGRATFRSTQHRNMTLHTPKGSLQIDAEGCCSVSQNDPDMHQHLRNQGFARIDDAEKTLDAIKAVRLQGRARQIAVAEIQRQRPGELVADDVCSWLNRRAKLNEGRTS